MGLNDGNNLADWLLGRVPGGGGATGYAPWMGANGTTSSAVGNTAVGTLFDARVEIPANTVRVGGVLVVGAVFNYAADGSGGAQTADVACVFGPTGSGVPTTGIALDNDTELAPNLGIVAGKIFTREVALLITAGGGAGDRGISMVGAGSQFILSEGISVPFAPSGFDETRSNEAMIQWTWANALAGNTVVQTGIWARYFPPA